MMKNPTPINELKLLHTREAIQRRLSKGVSHSYLKDFIYGSIDGTVTTFAVIAGVAGAHLSNNVVIILGLCNLFADGFSMAASNYLGTKTEAEEWQLAESEEKKQIALFPEGEKEEIRQIFASKGFQDEELERVVAVITANNQVWLETMMREELGLPIKLGSPFKAALATFSAFVIIGFFPLISFVANYIFPTLRFDVFAASMVITGSAFFIVGALKSRFTQKNWLWSGLGTLGLGGSAAFISYFIGILLKNL